jgi:hypothetical protein
MRDPRLTSGDPRLTDSDQIEMDLRGIAADLRELHTELDTDIAERRERRDNYDESVAPTDGDPWARG